MDFSQNTYFSKYNHFTQAGKEACFVYSAEKGDWMSVKELLTLGIKANTGNHFGKSALRQAAWNGHIITIDLLIAHGADIEAANADGETPLMLAAQNNQMETVDLLIQKGANVNAVSHKGGMALLMAWKQNHQEMVFRLLSTMSEQKMTETIELHPNLSPVFELFKQALYKNQQKLFSIFGPLWLTENQTSFFSTYFSRLPSEIMAKTLSFQFPAWYGHRIQNDATKFKVAPLSFLSFLESKQKNENNFNDNMPVENTRNRFY